MLSRWLTALAALLLVVLSGCAMKKDAAYAPEPSYYGAEADYAYDMDDYGGGMPMAESSRASMAPSAQPAPRPAQKASNSGGDGASGGESPEAVEPQAGPRMVHYNGYAQLRVTRAEDLVEEVAKLVEAKGGFIEQRTLTRITARVPVERFEDTYDAVLEMGDVLSRSVTAEDITESYQAVDLRLRTAMATRERLQELLAKATEENEKLELLRQIQRLTEQIDVVEAQLRTLAGLASYSRITVEGVQRDLFADRRNKVELDGFAFVQQLSPFRRDVTLSGKLLALDVPEGMVALDEKKHFVAESADGAVIRSGRLENEPRGDAAFWAEALKVRLGDEFAEAEISDVGGFKVLRLVEAGADDPYRWLIAVRTDGKHLDLVEVVYPSAAHEERYSAAVEAVLVGGQS